MHSSTVLASLLGILLIAGPTSSSAAPRLAMRAPVEFVPSLPKDTLPPWRYDDMTRVVVEESGSWSRREVLAVELLAWYAVVDDRPLYVNVALFGVRLSGGRWALVQLAQHPIPEPSVATGHAGMRTGWLYYVIFDVDWNPVAVFKGKPSTLEVDAFLRFWSEQNPWQVLSQGFRAQTWQAFLGLPVPAKLEGLNVDRAK